ncbi:MAG: hypothetical protein CMJ16_00700 [Peredibacter sp.]|nr:hypothetical protein [Peredibacter sp.]
MYRIIRMNQILKNLSIKLSPLYLIALLIVLGGSVFEIAGAKIEIGSVTVWAILAIFIYLPMWKRNPHLRSDLTKIYTKLFSFSPKKARIYILFFIGLSLIAHLFKHWSFNTHGYDISYVYQALFHPLRGPFFPSDFAPSGTALGEHLLFSLILITPITAFLHSDEFIVLIQHLTVMLGLYYLVFKSFMRNTPQFWAYSAFLFLSFKTLRASLVWNFREDIFIFTGLALFIYCIANRYLLRGLIFAILLLITKESVCLILPFVAIPIVFDRDLEIKHSKLLAITLVALSGIYFIVGYKFLLPHFAAGKMTSPFLVRFGDWGNSPSEVVINLITSPPVWWDAFKRLMAPFNIKYYLALLLPTLIIIGKNKRALLWLFPGIMGILMNAITGYKSQTSMSYHYDLIVLPFIFTSISIALIDYRDIFQKRLVWAMIFAVTLSGRWPGFYINKFMISSEDLSAQRIVNSLDTKLIAGNRMSAQVNHLKKYTPLRKLSLEEIKASELPILITLEEQDSLKIFNQLEHENYKTTLLHKKKQIILLEPKN